MTPSVFSRFLPLLLLAALAGCATVDPQANFEATRELVAGRHPGELHWLRDEPARAAAAARVAELLAAPLTPEAAAEVALLRNPALQATLAELGIAQADLAQATRLANPGFSFSTLSGGGETQRTASLLVDVVDWMVLPLRRKVAAAELERSRLAVGRALLDTVAEARLALLRYQAAAQLAHRLARIEEIDRAAADYAQALFAAGNISALERDNAAAGWAETRAELGRARAEAERQREAVVRALGLAGNENWRIPPELPVPPGTTWDVPALEQAALDQRLDLAAARWAVGALERAVVLKRRTRWLPLGLEVGVEREHEGDGVRLTGPVLELHLPLFDTGKASLARLSWELDRARWQLIALEGQARSEVRERAADLAAAAELARLYRETLLPLRLAVLEGTLREYNQMLIGTFDVLRVKQDEIAAERHAIEARADYWIAWVELERAVGAPLPAPPAAAARPDGGRESAP